jgi:hypothetical protein
LLIFPGSGACRFGWGRRLYGDKDDPEFEVEMSAIYDEMEAQA